MENILPFIQANWVNIVAIYGAVVILANTIVKLTPSQTDDAYLAKFLKVVDWFATVYPKPTKAA